MTYDLKSVHLPRLMGRGLKLFAAALDNPAVRPLLIGRLLKDGGIISLRQMRFSEAPTMKPLAFSEAPLPGTAPTVMVEPGQHQPTHEIPFATIADYANAYRQGVTTPEAVAQKVLTAVAASDRHLPPLRAFIAQDQDDVMAQAQAAAQRIAAGAPLSLLDGVPVAIKDEVNQVPYPTTVGTSFLGRAPAGADSTVVARLRQAGALLLGKTNMNEIGINPNGLNVHHGMVRNPYNLAYDTGGSSSGSAAAVAAGFCPVAIGADGGGSIRIPAAHCGLVGLKATYGRISEYGAAPLCWSVAHLGPIGATVADVALAYLLIAGLDEQDVNTQHQPPVTAAGWNRADLQGLTIGIFPPWFQHATPEIVQACEGMVSRFKEAGAQVQEIEIPELEAMRVAHAVTILSEMAASMANYPQHSKAFGAATRINLSMGQVATAHDYLQAQRMRTRAMRIFEQVYEKVDVVLTPATAVTAPLIPPGSLPEGWSDLSVVTEVMRYMIPGNLVGLPAIVFPVGYDTSGLPIGMQAMAAHWQEHILLRVAHVAELVVERKRPFAYYPILDAG